MILQGTSKNFKFLLILVALWTKEEGLYGLMVKQRKPCCHAVAPDERAASLLRL